MEVDQPVSRDASMISAASEEDMFASSQEDNEIVQQPTLVEVSERSKAESISSALSSSSTKEESWRGTPLSKMPKNIDKDLFPAVAVGPQHSVLFKLPVVKGQVPEPWPQVPVDVWDQNHVRLPHSASNLYPVTPTKLQKRWELVQEALSMKIRTSQQLEAAILHYNSKYSERWDFKALHSFFSETLEEMETEYFFQQVLPKVTELALSLPKLVTGGIPLLKRHQTHSVSLSQQQVSCLLANAFLCTFPRRNTTKKDSEYSTFPYINFNRLFNGDGAQPKGRMGSLHEKLKCLINYFRRVTTTVPEGVVTYSRLYVRPNDLPQWSAETARLPDMYVSSSGTIEDEGVGMLQMDFANRNIGGGVLGRGCVQEEIRFVICPELILARLFTEALDDTEAVIVTGSERFSIYRGYAESFEWGGNIQDSTPRDRFGRRHCSLVAIDALRFPSAKTQYTAAHINRELNKAYAGFSWGGGSRESVATGNWGCGAYRGDACLKSLLQLMAAAKTGRALAYFTFGNTELRDQLADMHSFLLKHQVTVGVLWKVVTSYSPAVSRHSLYDHIYQAVTTGSIPTPLKNQWPSKRPRVQKSSEEINTEKQDTRMSGAQSLNTEEIEKALESIKYLEGDSELAKPSEAKTLNVQQDKELCLKRLSSSWTNLNKSKRDFDSVESATKSEQSSEISHCTDKSGQSVGTGKQISNTSRKKKISDYFQPASKS